ncbi:MAG: ABC transporter ATP-binding protein [Acidobacteria bacterium]|nr:ABC transporter ATP-binding protein [Acidobacteriota bacterium]
MAATSHVPLAPVVRVVNVDKRYRKVAHAHRFLTLKSAIVGGDLFKALAPSEVFTALDGVSLDISHGETLGVIGSNGAGKSTLLKIIAGTAKPTAGTVTVDGTISALIELGAGFHPEISGRENVFINGIMLGLSRRQVAERFDDIVSFAELQDFIDAPVKTYSSGMYMRLGFSVAVHIEPDVLLIDEVLAVGDEAFVHKCLDKIAEFKRRGKTILLVSHSLESVRRLCDRVVWMKDGSIEQAGDPPKIIDAYLQWVARKEEGELAAGYERRSAAAEIGTAADAPGAGDKSATGSLDGAGTAVGAQEPTGAGSGEAPYEAGRWGSQQVLIDQVRLLDAQGAQHYVFACGDPMTIELTLRAKEEVDDFAVGIGVFNTDGVCCYGTNTDIERLGAGKLLGTAIVRMEIPELNLIEGTYYLDLAVHRIDGYPYDYQRGLTQFRTTSTIADIGVARLPHRWSFEGGIEWKKTTETGGDGSAT